jgi:transposase
MLRMDQVHGIRHKVLREGQSVRRVARELCFSRNTINKCLEKACHKHWECPGHKHLKMSARWDRAARWRTSSGWYGERRGR